MVSFGDLSSIWIKDELKRQNGLLRKLEESYNSLENKTGEYANGIHKMIIIRRKICNYLRDTKEV